MHGTFHIQLFWIAAACILAAITGSIAKRFGQPKVLGSLLAGIVFSIAFGWTEFFHQLRSGHIEFIKYLAEFAAMALLFRAGLEGNLKSIVDDAKSGWKVASIGVIMPMLGGFLYTLYAIDTPWPVALFQGGVFAATSVGITVAVLSELGVLSRPFAKTIISAAVIDDVLGLVVLSVCQALNTGDSFDGIEIAKQIGIAALFVFVIPLLGHFCAKPILKNLNKLDPTTREGIVLGWMCLYGALAMIAGLAGIVGAYFAGVALDEAFFKDTPGTEEDTASHDKPVEHFFNSLIEAIGPVFFVYAACSVDPKVFLDPTVLVHGLAFTAIAILGKLIAGLPVKDNKLAIGIGMIPRGEVGIIFAGLGLAHTILSPELYGASMIMVLLTTLVTPPLLGKILK
ncbi:MAG: cation:proton antiporter [Candidatus Levybacteria bacterium]|nr:cation:proton antiporter [Candidatus Levybacteria bacterium]